VFLPHFFRGGFKRGEKGISTADERRWMQIRKGMTEAWFALAGLLRFIAGESHFHTDFVLDKRDKAH